MVNKVTLIGNLGKDPEIRRLENGIAVAKFSLATNEKYKDKNGELVTQTEWHNIVAWRHLAELSEKFLKKGKLVYIEGKLTNRKWQDQEGKDKYITEVVANNLRFLDRKESGSGYTSSFPGAENAPPEKKKEDTTPSVQDTTAAPTEKPTAAPAEKATSAPAEKAVAEADDDLPF